MFQSSKSPFTGDTCCIKMDFLHLGTSDETEDVKGPVSMLFLDTKLPRWRTGSGSHFHSTQQRQEHLATNDQNFALWMAECHNQILLDLSSPFQPITTLCSCSSEADPQHLQVVGADVIDVWSGLLPKNKASFCDCLWHHKPTPIDCWYWQPAMYAFTFLDHLEITLLYPMALYLFHNMVIRTVLGIPVGAIFKYSCLLFILWTFNISGTI